MSIERLKKKIAFSKQKEEFMKSHLSNKLASDHHISMIQLKDSMKLLRRVQNCSHSQTLLKMPSFSFIKEMDCLKISPIYGEGSNLNHFSHILASKMSPNIICKIPIKKEIISKIHRMMIRFSKINLMDKCLLPFK